MLGMSGNSQNIRERRTYIEDLKDMATIFAGLTAAVVALLWYLGRSYARGYYEALNIELFHLNFSLWDYGEVAGPIAASFSTIFALLILILVLKRNGLPLLMYYYSRLSMWLKILVIISSFLSVILIFFSKENAARFFFLFCAFLLIAPVHLIKPRKLPYKLSAIGAVIALFLTLSLLMEHFGTRDGRRILTSEKVIRASITLSTPLINSSTVKTHELPQPSQKANSYVYDGLYLIEYNSGRYFFFSQIDKECKPERIYVIKEKDLKAIDYVMSQPTKPGCLPPHGLTGVEALLQKVCKFFE